ncbi:hypothetical protein ACQKF2_07230 [Pseudomonas hunanensis]|uniref:hypothetical protein n=1 Tax=Pseudomonas hunanensis TaxID=1247546 RepID=UPI003D06CB78
MRYNTGNPVGTDGSSDPRDLYDNAGIADLLINGPLGEYLSRLGVPLRSWRGIMQQVTDYLIDQGYESVYLTYGPGVIVERQTQLIQRDGELYRVMSAADIPLTLTGTWATDAPKLQAVGDAALRQALAAPAGSTLVGRGDGTVDDALTALESQILYLKAETDGTDVTAKVVDFFAKALTENRPWVVPPGDYTINPTAAIVIKTSGACLGRFLVPKANQMFRFDILRDDPAGTVISTTGWNALQRGVTNANALNAVGKNLFLSSTEVLIERIGSGGIPYYKREFIRCPTPGGIFNTAITRNYDSNVSLTVTAHTPSTPIRIKTLAVELTGPSGGVESNKGSIVVTRDNVILDQPYVHNPNPAEPRPVAIEVNLCADVTINQPDVRGFNYPGLGYGILNSTTIGLTVNGGELLDCRHGYTGVYTVDVTLNGGSYQVVDDHWTDRFTANDVKVYAPQGSSAFAFAGDDVTLNNPQQFGGRNLLGIRVDTPSLGGKVTIQSPRIQTRGETGNYHLFGFTSPAGTGAVGFTYTNKPRLPDNVIIEDVSVDSSTPTVYGAYLGTLQAPHTTWGTVCIRGEWKSTGSTVIGIFAEKNSNYQQDRRTVLINEARMDCGASGTAVYCTAADGVTTNAMDVEVANTRRGNLRYSGYSVNNLSANHAIIGSIIDDNSAATPIGVSVFNAVHMSGGSVSATLKNAAFMGCRFTASYTAFPLAANVTMVGNVKGTTVTGLPADIRANVVAPFS